MMNFRPKKSTVFRGCWKNLRVGTHQLHHNLKKKKILKRNPFGKICINYKKSAM
jgi:hypothetical protein